MKKLNYLAVSCAMLALGVAFAVASNHQNGMLSAKYGENRVVAQHGGVPPPDGTGTSTVQLA